MKVKLEGNAGRNWQAETESVKLVYSTPFGFQLNANTEGDWQQQTYSGAQVTLSSKEAYAVVEAYAKRYHVWDAIEPILDVASSWASSRYEIYELKKRVKVLSGDLAEEKARREMERALATGPTGGETV